MKVIFTLTFTFLISSLSAQVLLQQNFDPPFNPAANGWRVQNLSDVPSLSSAWFQGNTSFFNSFNGAPNAYYAASYLATNASTPATISTWLMTPTLNIVNGSFLEFMTRTFEYPAIFPDRLEVYLSTAGSGTNAGTTPTSVGTFSTLLISINPSLTTTGYPDVWTSYSVAITGIPTPTVGRIAFRYHVTNAGSSMQATNSLYIGIDHVKFTAPCNLSVSSYTTCAGQTLTLNANNVSTGNSYTWSPGSVNSSSMAASPSVTTVYTLSYTDFGTACPNLTSTITIAPQLNVHVSASTGSVCQGGSVTLTGWGSATSYTFLNTGATGTHVSVKPTATTIYTLAGSSNTCTGASTVQVLVYPTPTISAFISNTVACVNETVGLSATGASSYQWSGGTTSTASSLVFTTGKSSASVFFTVKGTSTEGCFGTSSLLLLVEACTGIAEKKDVNAISVFPNPFENELYLNTYPVHVILFNIAGKIVLKQKINAASTLDTSDLPSGCYLLKIETNEGIPVKSLKIIKK